MKYFFLTTLAVEVMHDTRLTAQLWSHDFYLFIYLFIYFDQTHLRGTLARRLANKLRIQKREEEERRRQEELERERRDREKEAADEQAIEESLKWVFQNNHAFLLIFQPFGTQTAYCRTLILESLTP